MKPLTKTQADFAAEHHNLIYAFLNKRKYSVDDFYDIAVFGYLHAVQIYLEREELREYAFSTIAFQAMRRVMWNHFRAMNCQKRRAEVRPYDEDSDMPVYGGNAWAEPESRLEAKERKVTFLRVLTPMQSRVAHLRADGYSINEVGRRFDMKPRLVEQELNSAGVTIYELAPELLDVAA